MRLFRSLLDRVIRVGDAATVRHLALNPGLAFGEAYMTGGVTAVEGTIHDALAVVLDNLNHQNMPSLALNAGVSRLLRRVFQANDAVRARRNVAHHYDLNGRLYALFLDRDRQYSCAYFQRGDETLEEAQAAKKRHIAAKLKLNRPGLEVLDIGCGWGGTALTLARDYGARVTGITLSEEQLIEARARAQDAGLADRVKFELMDYRAMERQFDRIVSVGMFEHVGVPNYPAYFATLKRCLKPDGVALVHSIGRFSGPDATNPWITKYIFPGGYSPALSEVLAPLERSGLLIADIEILRLHYAKTISHWRRRFAANRDAIAALYDERFCRMFEFYLSASELAFRVSDHMNFQLQIVRDRHTLPLTRDYMSEEETLGRFATALR
ncbi:MAG TPA: cyclopropane-fatty-acyl-phospholipid synthase family protein [Acidocella sp.]|nr:cyclopropane-fatty-acyl-phospholipid synthase family protein [Acidocella sp.]